MSYFFFFQKLLYCRVVPKLIPIPVPVPIPILVSVFLRLGPNSAHQSKTQSGCNPIAVLMFLQEVSSKRKSLVFLAYI